MCRSIKPLRRPYAAATPDEVRAAALQFVRKISGYQKPAKVNEEAFYAAVDEIASSSQRLLGRLVVRESARAVAPHEHRHEHAHGVVLTTDARA
jgi:hypothetical protein